MRRDAVFFTHLMAIPSVVLPKTGYHAVPPQEILLAAFRREKSGVDAERAL